MMKKIFTLLLTCSLVMSCSTLKDSTMLGIGIGGVVGGGLGAAAGSPNGNETRGALTGAAVGAGLGGLMAFLDFKEREKADKLKFGVTTKRSNTKAPYLTKPQVQRVWVPEKIEGDKFIEGHWLYVIERQSVWSKE